MSNKRIKQILKAAEGMDWMQVVLNGGPPCFHLENGRFCGRAERWFGHDNPAMDHEYVSLAALLNDLAGVRKDAREAAAR
jgi:hypothetical protein